MALNRPGAAELDTRTVFAYAAHEIWYMEAGISVVAAWRHYVRRCEVSVDGRYELCGKVCEMATDDRTEFAGLIAEFEQSFDLRYDSRV